MIMLKMNRNFCGGVVTPIILRENEVMVI